MDDTRQIEIIKMIKRQTDYSDDDIKLKLETYNNNYLLVIKEYMGITQENSSSNKYNNLFNNDKKSINQKIYNNIRNFMDDNIRQHEIREKKKNEVKLLNAIYNKSSHKDNITINET
jgi:hypothetical protein